MTTSTTDVLNKLLQQARLPAAIDHRAVGGGSINQTFRVSLSDGRAVFLKTHAAPPNGFFEAEAAGLQALGGTGTLRVPAVLAVSASGILLEWLSGRPGAEFASRLGEQLAALHAHTARDFGFEMDNFCGLTAQPNPRSADGFAFFAEARLLFQARLAQDSGGLQDSDVRRVERIAGRLRDWIPEQPASLIHGDLWSGNVHVGPKGEPVLIDPAAHYGWAEADLAMTTLFGRQPDAFYAAYRANSSVSPDWEERIPLYNLYHLLNHLNLFGGGYRSSVQSVLSRFA